MDPQIVICDEAVSALDVSVQAQVIDLLQDLKRDFGLNYLFIAHDLAVVREIADQVAVMKAGRVVEEGSCDQIFADPGEDYTRELLAAVPHIPAELDQARIRAERDSRSEGAAPWAGSTTTPQRRNCTTGSSSGLALSTGIR